MSLMNASLPSTAAATGRPERGVGLGARAKRGGRRENTSSGAGRGTPNVPEARSKAAKRRNTREDLWEPHMLADPEGVRVCDGVSVTTHIQNNSSGVSDEGSASLL